MSVSASFGSTAASRAAAYSSCSRVSATAPQSDSCSSFASFALLLALHHRLQAVRELLGARRVRARVEDLRHYPRVVQAGEVYPQPVPDPKPLERGVMRHVIRAPPRPGGSPPRAA